MSTIADAMSAIAILAVAIVYGTDLFCALIIRPAAAASADSSIADLIGHIHEFGDRRMPVPGIIGIIATGGLIVLADTTSARIAATIAVVALLAWLGIYIRVSAPINKRLRAAAADHTVPTDARELQQQWDRVIWPRAALQAVALGGLIIVIAAG
ncbi:MAG: DUF1772 domain-containing protein [Gordonia sp. (in: high G+C Gram-positive bacteria)]